jgi:hypothetical protein
VKGDVGWDRVGSKGTCVFLFIHQINSSYPHTVVIEIELVGIIDGVSNLDTLSNIGKGHLIDRAFEADGGIVIDYAFMADEEDLIQFCLWSLWW